MTRNEAVIEFGRQPRIERSFDTLAEATAQATWFAIHYPGPYCCQTAIYPIGWPAPGNDGKFKVGSSFLLLVHWYDLGT
jgi:hypothetical protein